MLPRKILKYRVSEIAFSAFRAEHIEVNSSMKSVATAQIKRACQNYWGAQAPPAPPHATALKRWHYKVL